MTITCFIRYEIDPFQREAFRQPIKSDAEGRANFEFAQRERFILREEPRFLEVVPETFQQPAQLAGAAAAA